MHDNVFLSLILFKGANYNKHEQLEVPQVWFRLQKESRGERSKSCVMEFCVQNVKLCPNNFYDFH